MWHSLSGHRLIHSSVIQHGEHLHPCPGHQLLSGVTCLVVGGDGPSASRLSATPSLESRLASCATQSTNSRKPPWRHLRFLELLYYPGPQSASRHQ